jgi:hypothetical protein
MFADKVSIQLRGRQNSEKPMASVHKFPAVKTGRQGEFGSGSWRGSKQLQGLASKGGTEENGGTAELEH